MDDLGTDREGDGVKGPKRHWFQFRLKTILIVVTLIAVFASGFTYGYRKGRAKTVREILLEEMRTRASQQEIPHRLNLP